MQIQRYMVLTIATLIGGAYIYPMIPLVNDDEAKSLEWNGVVTKIAQYGSLSNNTNELSKVLKPTQIIPQVERTQNNLYTLLTNSDSFENIQNILQDVKNNITELEQFISNIQDEQRKLQGSLKNANNAFNILQASQGQYSQSRFIEKVRGFLPRWLPSSTPDALLTIGALSFQTYSLYNSCKSCYQIPFSQQSSLLSTWHLGTGFAQIGAITNLIKNKLKYIKNAHQICQIASDVTRKAQELDNILSNLGVKDPDIQMLHGLFKHGIDKEVYAYLSQEGGIESIWNMHTFAQKVATFSQLTLSTDELTYLTRYVRKVDALATCARMIQENPDSFSRVEFLKSKSEPHIHLKDFWTPTMLDDRPIKNDIEIGDKRGIIISGPNGTGKSTAMKSIAQNVMLAHSIGYAPASKAQMTPFSCITTYLNVTENPNEGLSRFQAEAQRINTIGDTIEHGRGFKLCLMDEPLQGTTPDAAGKLIYELGKYLSQNARTISILASHLKEPASLEHKYPIQNYHIETIESPDREHNSFCVTRKLKDGLGWWFSDQSKQMRFLEYFMPGNNDSSLFHKILGSAKQSQQTSKTTANITRRHSFSYFSRPSFS